MAGSGLRAHDVNRVEASEAAARLCYPSRPTHKPAIAGARSKGTRSHGAATFRRAAIGYHEADELSDRRSRRMAWLIPALKAVLPHVGTIVGAAVPVFTKKGADVQLQITELQAAASQNAANIKELAEQLRTTVAALEQAASVADARLRRTLWLCRISTAISVAALAAALTLLFGAS